MPTSLSIWGSTVRVETLDPALTAQARRVVASCLNALKAAADPLASRSAPQRLAAAGGRPVSVPALFADLVLASLDAAQAVDGACDPTAGNAVALFSSGPGSRRPGEPLGAAAAAWTHPHVVRFPSCGSSAVTAGRPAAGWRRIEQAGTKIAVPAGTLLDVTATAKAFLAISASAFAARQTGTGVLVDVGGDVSAHGPAPAGGWRVGVGVGTASRESVRIGPGLALSSVGYERVVDPATGRPVPPLWRRVTVLGQGCIGNKALALGAQVVGPDAKQWLADRGVAARLETLDGDVHRLPGWPVTLVSPRPASPAERLATAS